VVTKKSKASWVATIKTTSDECVALAASLACEEVDCKIDGTNSLNVTIHGNSASDLRAKYNSTLRSLRAASEALSNIV